MVRNRSYAPAHFYLPTQVMRNVYPITMYHISSFKHPSIIPYLATMFVARHDCTYMILNSTASTVRLPDSPAPLIHSANLAASIAHQIPASEDESGLLLTAAGSGTYIWK